MSSPKEQALSYWEDKKVGPLFEFLASRVIVCKPDDPNKFLLEELTRIEHLKATGKPAVAFNEEEIGVMFVAFDVTSKGSVSHDQYLQGIFSVLVNVYNMFFQFLFSH